MKFVSSIETLSQLVASNSKEPILIGGGLVLLSHDKAAAADIGTLTDRYVAQPPRMASRKSIFDKGKKNLYVSIDKQAVEMILAYRGAVALSADQYLAYGLSQKKNVIVIGGGSSGGEASLEGFVFTDQSLVDTFEKPTSLNGYMLDLVLKEVLDEYPEHYIHWCSPLEPLPACDIRSSDLFVDAGDEALKSLVKRKVYSRKQSEEEGWGGLPAGAIALAGLLVFSGATGYQWAQLERERAEYRKEINGYEEAYQNSTHSLELLRHRDYLLSAQSENLVKIALLDKLIIHAASIDGVLIHSINVLDQDGVDSMDGQESGLFLLDLSVPKNNSLSGARQQAEGLVKAMNAQLGMTVRVVAHTPFSHSYGNETREYWRYTLGGSQ